MGFPDFKRFFKGGSVPEKRATERVHMWEHAEGTLRDLATNAMYEAEVRDLSKQGVRVACEKNFSVGTLFEIELRFPAAYPGEKRIRARVQVIHSYKLEEQRRYRVGCQFSQLDPISLVQIEKFVTWMKARAKKD